MATFRTYAEILTPDMAQAKAYAAGKTSRPPGRLLREYLDLSGGKYEFRMCLSAHLSAEIQAVAVLSGDPALGRLTEGTEIAISLEHLRELDPDRTRVVCGMGVEYTQAEARQLRAVDPPAPLQDRVPL